MRTCSFGDNSKVVGLFWFSRGCVCFPDDAFQDLCMQHLVNSEPLGSMSLVIDYTEGMRMEKVENKDDAILVLRQALGVTVQLLDKDSGGNRSAAVQDAKDVLQATSRFDPRTSSDSDADYSQTSEEERQKTRERSVDVTE